jgi:hypothetical protein
MSQSASRVRHGNEASTPHTQTQEDEVNDFMLIYQGGDPSWTERSPEEVEAVMQQWTQWFKDLEASGNLRDPGAALAPGGVTLKQNGSAVVTDTSMAEVKELIGGFSLIQAESIEAATELAKGSPFLGNNPGGSVVVRPVHSPEA